MRENGVAMEDPPPGGMAVPGIPAMDAGSPEMKKVEAAAEKCAELLSRGHRRGAQDHARRPGEGAGLVQMHAGERAAGLP